MQLCIYPPRPNSLLRKPEKTLETSQGQEGDNDKEGHGFPVAWSCAEEAIMAVIRQKDPLGLGLPSPVALRLMQVSRYAQLDAGIAIA